MTKNTRDRRDEPFGEGENPYLPPTYFLAALAVCVLAILATFL